MSGGYFDFCWTRLTEPADQIKDVIRDMDYDESRNYLIEGMISILEAQEWMKIIDYYLSGDHSEESFRQECRKVWNLRYRLEKQFFPGKPSDEELP